MNILQITCSPRGQASESYRLSQNIIGLLMHDHPAATLVHRAVGGGELPLVDEPYATSQQSHADISRQGSIARSDLLIAELDAADIVVIATPMHNFTVPAALKVWIDHIARVRRTFNVGAQGKTSLLRDRPVFVAVASGGRFSGVTPRQPDFLTPYLKAVLGMIGLHDLMFFSVEGTAMGPEAVALARSKTEEALLAYFER
jgi:FMN-dependent NADH-azoreductase